MPSDDQRPKEQTDLLVRSFLQAQDAAETEQLLGELLSNHAEPVIRNITRSRQYAIRASLASRKNTLDTEDVRNEVVLRLLARLRDLKANPGDAQIENFQSYVAAVTYNCYYELLRQKYPERLRLKNRVRYALNHHPDLALWDSNGGEWLCGSAAWKQFNGFTKNRERLGNFSSDLENFQRLALPSGNARKIHLADLLVAIFSWMQCPVEFDELVTIVAGLYGIKDELKPAESGENSPGERCETLPDRRVDIAAQVERRLYLEHVWSEICQLPPRQRIALLLNLRDGNGRDVLALFPLTGVATLRQIAAVLNLLMDEFAELWNSLPLDDLSIARRMGITRQQVINLRKSARERLARRIQHFEEKGRK